MLLPCLKFQNYSHIFLNISVHQDQVEGLLKKFVDLTNRVSDLETQNLHF